MKDVAAGTVRGGPILIYESQLFKHHHLMQANINSFCRSGYKITLST
jgi:hypothetical protein